MTATILGRIRNLRNRINAEGTGFDDGDYYLDYIPTPEVAIKLISNPKPSVRQSRKPVGTEPIVLSLLLMDRFFAEGGKDASSLISLYLFYYQQARKQKTNQPWATNRFVAKNTHIGISKVKKLKQKLITMELIQNIPKLGKDGKIQHWYIRVNYLWNTATSMNFIPVVTDTTSMKSPPVVKSSDNALSENKINSSSEEKIKKGDFLPVTTYIHEKEESSEIPEPVGILNNHSPRILEAKPQAGVVPPATPTAAPVPQVQSYEEYLAALTTMGKRCKIPAKDIVTIAEADRQYFDRYKTQQYYKQLKYWQDNLFSQDNYFTNYRNLMRLWAIYCRNYRTTNKDGKYPRKDDFGKTTKADARELLMRFESVKSDYIPNDFWQIMEKFIKHYVNDTPIAFLYFNGLFKPQSWAKYHDDDDSLRANSSYSVEL